MNSSFTSVRKLTAFFIAATCITAGAMSIQSPALAVSDEQHCAAKVGTATSKPGAAVCFKTFAQAISFATGGAVKLPANATQVTEEQLEQGYAKSRAAMQSIVIGISFANRNYQGNTFSHWADAGCDGDQGTEWHHQFNSAWNDQTSSARAYSSCNGLYWEGGTSGTSGFGASVWTDWSGTAMDNSATFVEWK